MHEDEPMTGQVTSDGDQQQTVKADETAGGLLAPGERVGRYVVRERLGEGGFAEVYLAEQQEPVRRRVALKIIKPGMDTKQVIARFEAERQALAMMDHPNVAKVFDAGSTEAGRPFFVMEHVPGISITEYSDRHRLDIKQRLDLFVQVCEAVQHAHQKAIIHRDLKPSNVLVSDRDGEPHATVIDFGVAKAVNHRLTEKTIFTEQGQLIGTPEYMSPEQAEMTSENIDTRTDIYSLGVLLYELITGSLPFDARQLRRAGYAEIQRTIREIDPPKPSTRLSRLSERLAAADGEGSIQEIARRHRVDPGTLIRQVRGDLDWIVMKAVDKERTRRYETASALAMDIQRHMKHEPVVASPPRVSYRMRKFVRRHRVGVAAGVAIGLALVAGLTLSLIGFAQAVHQRNLAGLERTRALAARDESEAITEFLSQMLSSASPWEQGQDVTVRQVLDAASEELDEKFVDQPSIRARLHQTIGHTYTDLAVWERAESHLKAAIDEYQQLHGDDHPSLGEVFHDLGKLYWMSGRPEDAERWIARGHEMLARHLGPEDEKTLQVAGSLGLARHTIGRSDDAERLLREVLEKDLDPEGATRLTAMNNLALVLSQQGRNEEARQIIEQVVEIRRRVLGEDHPDTVTSINNLATALQNEGKLTEATPLFEETLAIRRQYLTPDHRDTVVAINNLAYIYLLQERYEESLPLYEKAIEAFTRSMGRDFYGTGIALKNYGKCLLHFERLEEAEEALKEAHEILAGAFGPDHFGVHNTVRLIVEVYEASERPQLAAEWEAKLPTEQEPVAKDQPGQSASEE